MVAKITQDRASTILGLQSDGRLLPCPNLRNCVCSHYPEDVDHFIEALHFQGTIEEGRHRLRSILTRMPQARVIVEKGSYLRAEFTSKLFKFVDDVEFLLAPSEGKIHVRSASRLGYWDVGANRKRIGEIRRLFEQGEP